MKNSHSKKPAIKIKIRDVKHDKRKGYIEVLFDEWALGRITKRFYEPQKFLKWVQNLGRPALYEFKNHKTHIVVVSPYIFNEIWLNNALLRFVGFAEDCVIPVQLVIEGKEKLIKLAKKIKKAP